MGGLPGWVRMIVVAALAGVAALPAGAQAPATQPRLAFRATTREDAQAWQQSGRKRLFELLGLLDLVQAEKGATTRPESPLKPAVGATKRLEKFTRYDVQISPTPGRTIPVVLTVPHGAGKFPAVVCIHGHGHDRNTVYEPDSIYRGFALTLAQRGYVTISADVGQHKVSQPGRTLMGERLWDLMSCVGYLRDRPEVDGERIACAGLSLGGEMAMWLGAMDTRVKAVVSSGFLTTVENLRQGHCPCWEFPGLTENFDIPDIYCLIAPRRLQCQIGRKEAAPGGFPLPVAEKAMEQVRRAYKVLGSPQAAELKVHDEGHVFDLASALAFLDKALSRPAEGRRVHVFVSGRVQGVGFRAFTRQEALALKLTGWVKNLADGRVEAVVEGPPDKVAALLERLRRGPEGARVDKLDARDEAHTGELETFEVRF